MARKIKQSDIIPKGIRIAIKKALEAIKELENTIEQWQEK